jgi:hypothetical protein
MPKASSVAARVGIGVRLLVLVTLVMRATPARAAGYGWTPPEPWEIAMIAAADAAIVIDAWQTLDLRNHSGVWEANPLLGERPSQTRIILFGSVAAPLVSTALWLVLPKRARWIVPTLIIPVECAFIVSNHSAGMRVHF